jgi:hypothetical protein
MATGGTTGARAGGVGTGGGAATVAGPQQLAGTATGAHRQRVPALVRYSMQDSQEPVRRAQAARRPASLRPAQP